MDNLTGPTPETQNRDFKDFYEREYKRLKLLEDTFGQENINLKCELYAAEQKISELKEELEDVYHCKFDNHDCHGCLDEDNCCCSCPACMEEELAKQQQTIKEKDELIKKILIGKLEDGDISNRFLEDVRSSYRQDIRDTEDRLSKETAIHKQRAADEINKNAFLQAEIRRLEKALKRVTEDNMRLRFPVRECEDDDVIRCTCDDCMRRNFDSVMMSAVVRLGKINED